MARSTSPAVWRISPTCDIFSKNLKKRKPQDEHVLLGLKPWELCLLFRASSSQIDDLKSLKTLCFLTTPLPIKLHKSSQFLVLLAVASGVRLVSVPRAKLERSSPWRIMFQSCAHQAESPTKALVTVSGSGTCKSWAKKFSKPSRKPFLGIESNKKVIS